MRVMAEKVPKNATVSAMKSMIVTADVMDNEAEGYDERKEDMKLMEDF